MVEVTFSYSKVEGGDSQRTLSGTLLFDPNRYWCLRSADIQQKGNLVRGTKKVRITQSPNAGGLPPLSRVYESDADWVGVAKGWPDNRQKMRFDMTLSRPSRLPPDEEFTLSAFGIKEPPGVKWEKPTPFYVWVLVAAAACAVLGFGARYLRNRHRTTAPEIGGK